MNLSAELKTLQGGKMESERGRKRAEGQLQELNARLAQAEREREEREERLSKLQVEMGLSTKATTFTVCTQGYLTSEINILISGGHQETTPDGGLIHGQKGKRFPLADFAVGSSWLSELAVLINGKLLGLKVSSL